MVEIIGWIGAALTLTAWSMKTMLPLRTVALLSNVFFMSYGALAGVYPMLILHVILLPLNGWRLFEIIRLTRRLRSVTAGDSPLDWLRPLMKPTLLKSGDYVFRKGEAPDHVYILDSGTILLEELDHRLQPGEVFGEMAFFTDARARTLSARCEGDCSLMLVDEAKFMQLYFQNPAFGYYIIKLIARRLLSGRTAGAEACAEACAPAD